MIEWIVGAAVLALFGGATSSRVSRSRHKGWTSLSATHGPAFTSWSDDRIDELVSSIEEVIKADFYPAICDLPQIVREAAAAHEGLKSQLLRKTLPFGRSGIPEQKEADEQRYEALKKFLWDPAGWRDELASKFIEVGLVGRKGFFDSVESNQLSPEQRVAVLTDEEATLVLASAGSGKTSVIAAKTINLVETGMAMAEEILLLAFARPAAKEITERIKERSGLSVPARTFHKLAYDIIGEVEGCKPPLANHAGDEKLYCSKLKAIIEQIAASDIKFATALAQWFTVSYVTSKSEWDFQTKHDWYTYVEKVDLRTLQGERVKSYEELLIANWLYLMGVEYEYEAIYPHPTESDGRRKYQPDFHLPESGIFIEHLGVRIVRDRWGAETYQTAPFVDRDSYIAGIEWKRGVHSQNQTQLVETYSHERDAGNLLELLEQKLSGKVECRPRDPLKIFDRVVEIGQIDGFSRLIGSFLKRYKAGSYSTAFCLERAKVLKTGPRADAFLQVFEPIFYKYQSDLNGRIDFEDMVNRAASHVESGAYKSFFSHIVIDEFQDISQDRARLVRALKESRGRTKVFAVGDDWQSIFGFAGSDISIMRNFGPNFGGEFAGTSGLFKLVDLGRTFRSVDKIALPAREFILRNPEQLEKKVIPAGEVSDPRIKVLWTKDTSGTVLYGALQDINDRFCSRELQTVLLLGRYRFNQPDCQLLQRAFPHLSIRFSTIHSAKGREADHVILLEAKSDRTGFPSRIEDDPLLALVSPDEDPFEHGEERRVMYVAMTRARHSLTILAPETKPSEFVRELLGDPVYGAAVAKELCDGLVPCSECGGRMILATGSNNKSYYHCEHTQHCRHIMPACHQCGSGFPLRDEERQFAVCGGCDAAYKPCGKCEDGWMVERSSRYGPFMGCSGFPACNQTINLPHLRMPLPPDVVVARS
ncbi:UvrD-helicase domain-containing protein [Sphingomonas sp. LY160]|uniref:UvrD-helicase domain-containing protein n=1 Tax=Sphingomonas sp. LY160 TaxID=3095342 RepID=UPI002ADECBE8|nr:UvrD-helicase domain-containing protein [Sphingomonas sp. LY160]MEA1071762.1 UvrD-helicase domain-containing protein [Sphingomonas sp. LY160]